MSNPKNSSTSTPPETVTIILTCPKAMALGAQVAEIQKCIEAAAKSARRECPVWDITEKEFYPELTHVFDEIGVKLKYKKTTMPMGWGIGPVPRPQSKMALIASW